MGRQWPSNTNIYCDEIIGNKGEQWEDKTSGKGKHHQANKSLQIYIWEITMGDKKGGQDLGKADAPSKTCRHTCTETRRDKGRRVDKTSGRPTHQDTPSNKGKQEGAPWETKGESNKGKHERIRWETKKTNSSERRTYHPT